MKISGTDLFMTRGDTEAIAVAITGADLSGALLEFTVRQTVFGPPVIYKRVTDFPEGKAHIDILPQDTEQLEFGQYVYDVQLTVGEMVKTIIKPAKFMIGQEVTYNGD